jgi:hypothetical protein
MTDAEEEDGKSPGAVVNFRNLFSTVPGDFSKLRPASPTTNLNWGPW